MGNFCPYRWMDSGPATIGGLSSWFATEYPLYVCSSICRSLLRKQTAAVDGDRLKASLVTTEGSNVGIRIPHVLYKLGITSCVGQLEHSQVPTHLQEIPLEDCRCVKEAATLISLQCY
jgi:hypothetical protein